MKKAILSTAVAVMMSTTAAFATDMALDGTIETTLAAGFSEQNSVTGINAFAVGAASTVSFGSVGSSGTLGSISKNIFVRTNDIDGVSMTLSSANSGNLVESQTSETIAVAYTFGGVAIVLDEAFEISPAKDDGSASTGAFVMTPATATAQQAPGEYTDTLSIVIAAR